LNLKYKKIIHQLTKERELLSIKLFLENLPVNEKGSVFEWYLAELFQGNGWLVKVQGGRYDLGADILLYHPKTPFKVSLIIQAKNQSVPIRFDDVKVELIKFEEKGSEKHSCNQFRIVSINGFVKEAIKLQEFNMLLLDWNYVETLIIGYDPRNKTEPSIELYAHNKITYDAINELWKKDKSVAVVQATGTGKSYIIAKVMADFLDQKILIMAPSRYILKQQQSKIPWATRSSTFMTYAKGVNLSSAEVSRLKCKLIILDEFHRCGADIWGDGVQKILAAYPDSYILGTSATPVRYLDNSRDMCDELFRNNVAGNISLAEAIVRGILPSPTYISALCTLAEESENLLNSLKSCRKKETEIKEFVSLIHQAMFDWEKTSGIPEILRKHLTSNINKIIVFCRNEDHLAHMEVEVQRWFQKAKTHKWRKVYRVLSADPSSDENLEMFKDATNKDTLHLLFAIDMLNEGLHIPDVGSVILLRPTVSPVIFYQQIGRCLQVGTDHPPIIFDFVNNFDSIKANDFLKDVEENLSKRNNIRKSYGLETFAANFKIIDEIKEIHSVFESIAAKILPWKIGFKQLKMFVKRNGHARIHVGYTTPSGFHLGRWINNKRKEFKNKRLPQEKITLIEAIDGWTWNPLETDFQEGLNHLKQFAKDNGHSRVPARYIASSGFKLGRWVGTVRSYFKTNNLVQEKITLIEAIDGWTWDPLETDFQEGLDHLKQFAKDNGHTRVSTSYLTSSGFKLGKWVISRRRSYKNNNLSETNIAALEATPNWIWDPVETDFQEGLDHLKQFIKINGHTTIPTRYVTSCGFKLGLWVSSRRKSHRTHILAREKVKILESIPGWTWISKKRDSI
jgi:superfamily II DNA or RNA helicase